MRAVAILVLFALAGCRSYEIVQTNIFSDDLGNVVRIDYGRSDETHENTFVNPATGKTMDFKSNLVVEVRLPDGDEITGWQCMNFRMSGTMYKTDDEEWMIHVNGFTCEVLRRGLDRHHPDAYLSVYRGLLCESPKNDSYKPNPKWRKLEKNAEGKWR